MWFFRGRDYHTYNSTRYESRNLGSASHGTWTCITPENLDRGHLPGIVHKSMPLKDIFNRKNKRLVTRVVDDSWDWIDFQAIKPMLVPSNLSLGETHTLRLSRENPTTGIDDIEQSTLKLVLDLVEQVARYHSSKWLEKNPNEEPRVFHITWGDPSDFATLDQDEHIALPVNSIIDNVAHAASVLRLMRAPGPYEGGVDYMFEKFVKVAVSLLFDTNIVFLKGTDCLPEGRLTEDRSYPLIVAGGCFAFNDDVRKEMIEILHPTLVHLVQFHRRNKTADSELPEHCVLYALHWSRTRIQIFAHFPVETAPGDDPAKWKFCQALVAQHWVSLEEKEIDAYRNELISPDDTFLCRWRLTLALSAIRARIRELEQLLQQSGGLPVKTPANLHVHSPKPPRGAHTCVPQTSRVPQFILMMREFWRAQRLAVPEEWIPIEDEIVAINPTQKKGSYIIVNRAVLMLSKIIRHSDPTFLGPDFFHPIYVPRSFFKWKILDLDPDTLDNDSRPHLNRFYDLLSMHATSWEEANLFVASVFSSFSNYSIRWKPKTRYSSVLSLQSTDATLSLATDFALVVQNNPPVTWPTVKRAAQSPLTISSPAVVLGLRTTNFDLDGSGISKEELDDLKVVMGPHLRMVDFALTQDDARASEPEAWPAWATLFCIYLKAGFVHILAFSLASHERVEFCVVDSLPIIPVAKSIADLENRARLAVALFTLEKHVVRFSERWGKFVWSRHLLKEEHDAIIEVTGVFSGPPSKRNSVHGDGGNDGNVNDEVKADDNILEKVNEQLENWAADTGHEA
ncbi:unnamed protein product [Somion occarium]|uniref:Uncharacterized protein n=1 Tax=Somion occarium TaxID=3059160 RepID=A0ABP1DUK8_9APHY